MSFQTKCDDFKHIQNMRYFIMRLKIIASASTHPRREEAKETLKKVKELHPEEFI